jgi:hypothetical protein
MTWAKRCDCSPAREGRWRQSACNPLLNTSERRRDRRTERVLVASDEPQAPGSKVDRLGVGDDGPKGKVGRLPVLGKRHVRDIGDGTLAACVVRSWREQGRETGRTGSGNDSREKAIAAGGMFKRKPFEGLLSENGLRARPEGTEAEVKVDLAGAARGSTAGLWAVEAGWRVDRTVIGSTESSRGDKQFRTHRR